MIQLRGITWDHPRGFGPLEASQALYPEAAEVRVHWEKRSLKDFGDAPLADLCRDYDLVVLDHPHAGVAAAEGCLMPLDRLLPESALSDLAAESAGPSFKSYAYADHQWALPVDAACQVSSCRPDLMDGRPLPQTWAEVFDLARDLAAAGLHAGMALCPTDTLCSFLTLCAQLGILPAEGSETWELMEQGGEVLDRLRQLRDCCHPQSLHWNPIALYNHMSAADSRIAYAPLAFGYSNYARPDTVGLPLRFGGIPGRTGALLGGAGVGISVRCANAPAAARYLHWLCGSAYQAGGYTAHGGQPGNAAAWRNPEADRMAGGFFSQTFDTLCQACMRPRHAGWPPFQEFLGERVHQFLRHPGEDPRTVLHHLQTRYHETFRI